MIVRPAMNLSHTTRLLALMFMLSCASVACSAELSYEILKKPLGTAELKKYAGAPLDKIFNCYLKIRGDDKEFFLAPYVGYKSGPYGLNEKSIRQQQLDAKGELFLFQWRTLSQGSGGWEVAGFLILLRRDGKHTPLLHSWYMEHARSGWMGSSFTTIEAAYFESSSTLSLSFCERQRYSQEQPMPLGIYIERPGDIPAKYYSRISSLTNNYLFALKHEKFIPLTHTQLLDVDGGPYKSEGIAAFLNECKINYAGECKQLSFPLILKNEAFDKFPVETFAEAASLE